MNILMMGYAGSPGKPRVDMSIKDAMDIYDHIDLKDLRADYLDSRDAVHKRSVCGCRH